MSGGSEGSTDDQPEQKPMGVTIGDAHFTCSKEVPRNLTDESIDARRQGAMDFATASQTWHRRSVKRSLGRRITGAVTTAVSYGVIGCIVVVGGYHALKLGTQVLFHAVDHEMNIQEAR